MRNLIFPIEIFKQILDEVKNKNNILELLLDKIQIMEKWRLLRRGTRYEKSILVTI